MPIAELANEFTEIASTATVMFAITLVVSTADRVGCNAPNSLRYDHNVHTHAWLSAAVGHAAGCSSNLSKALLHAVKNMSSCTLRWSSDWL